MPEDEADEAHQEVVDLVVVDLEAEEVVVAAVAAGLVHLEEVASAAVVEEALAVVEEEATDLSFASAAQKFALSMHQPLGSGR